MDNLINILKELKRKQHKNAVLATIIKVEGSSYRKEGTCMLFSDENSIGMLSVGCLEEELEHQVKSMVNGHRESQVLIYDMSAEHDLGWGRGAGCNGKLHILLEVVTASLYKKLLKVQDLIESNDTVMIVKSVRREKRWTVYLSESGRIFGDKRKIQTVSRHLLSQYKRNGCARVPGFEEECFIQIVKPAPRMFIFGAGEDVKPLVEIAGKVGMNIHIWDWRPAKIEEMKSYNIKLARDTTMSDFVEGFTYKIQDAIIVMTHDFQKDQEILKKINACNPPSYVGVMGPKNRTKRLLSVNKTVSIPKLDSPVGMSIGAQGPEEIAVSIMANVIKHIRLSIYEGERLHGDEQTNNWDLPSCR